LQRTGDHKRRRKLIRGTKLKSRSRKHGLITEAENRGSEEESRTGEGKGAEEPN
jgi:hypothetical protein